MLEDAKAYLNASDSRHASVITEIIEGNKQQVTSH